MIQNSCQIAGRVGRAPEVFTGRNGEILSFSVCVNERYKKDEQWVEKQTWIPCVCFQTGRVNYLKEHLGKGSFIILNGRLETNQYTSQKYFDASGKPLVDSKLQLVVEEFLLPDQGKRQEQPTDSQTPLGDNETDHEAPF
ncbi:TPA: single-stranded DNA-binding protein [Neisseria subflava]|jgi:single-strand binding protein